MRSISILCLSLLSAFPGFAQEDCSKLRDPLCLLLKHTKEDSTRLDVSIIFSPPTKPGRGDSAYWSNLSSNLTRFFSTYEVLDRNGLRITLPDPLDVWEFRNVRADKRALIGMSNESYLERIELWSWGGPSSLCNKISGPLCQNILGGTDSSAFHPFQVFFSFSAGKEQEEIEHFFSTYDIRDSLGLRRSAPDSNGTGAFIALQATGNTILDLAKEGYVRLVEKWERMGLTSGLSRPDRINRRGPGQDGYRVDGRRTPPNLLDPIRKSDGRR